MTSSCFFLSTLNYDARSTTHQINKLVSTDKNSNTTMPSRFIFVRFYLISCYLIPSPIDGTACFYASEYFITLLLLLYLLTYFENPNYTPNFKILFFHCFGSNDFTSATVFRRGKCWRSSMRHCATSRKVTGSIPDGVI